MPNYIIDMQSFNVEADDIDDARYKAIQMIESGEITPAIDQVILDAE